MWPTMKKNLPTFCPNIQPKCYHSEEAAKEVANEVTKPRTEIVRDIRSWFHLVLIPFRFVTWCLSTYQNRSRYQESWWSVSVSRCGKTSLKCVHSESEYSVSEMPIINVFWCIFEIQKRVNFDLYFEHDHFRPIHIICVILHWPSSWQGSIGSQLQLILDSEWVLCPALALPLILQYHIKENKSSKCESEYFGLVHKQHVSTDLLEVDLLEVVHDNLHQVCLVFHSFHALSHSSGHPLASSFCLRLCRKLSPARSKGPTLRSTPFNGPSSRCLSTMVTIYNPQRLQSTIYSGYNPQWLQSTMVTKIFQDLRTTPVLIDHEGDVVVHEAPTGLEPLNHRQDNLRSRHQVMTPISSKDFESWHTKWYGRMRGFLQVNDNFNE